jgi:hypothetical protein
MARLITTLATPNYKAFFDLTYPHMKAYAAKCDAMISVVTEPQKLDKGIPLHFAKYKLLADAYASGATSVLYLDTDVYIRQGAPNIFEEINNATSLFSEVADMQPWALQKATEWIKANLGEYDATRYYNTGVMLFRQQDLRRLVGSLRKLPLVSGIFAEQDQLNYQFQKLEIPIINLPQVWNQFCAPHWMTEQKAQAAHFLHGCGVGGFNNKLNLLKHYMKAYP